MQKSKLDYTLIIKKGDITKNPNRVDAIVNAANNRLSGGGGVDGAIHRAAGERLLKECSLITGGCPTGEVRVTYAYNLNANYIFHTVGPVYDNSSDEAIAESQRLLQSCYKKCIEKALSYNLRSIAFPCISTGVYRYPSKEAAYIAVTTVIKLLEEYKPAYKNQSLVVYFVTFNEQDNQIYKETLNTYWD